MQSSKLALSSLLLRKKRLFQRSPRHAVLFSPSGYLGVKMEKKKNQHYVPQYYFKFFNDRQHFISILLVSKGKVIASSSVAADRKSVVEGKCVSVRVDLGGCRIIKKNRSNNRDR